MRIRRCKHTWGEIAAAMKRGFKSNYYGPCAACEQEFMQRLRDRDDPHPITRRAVATKGA